VPLDPLKPVMDLVGGPQGSGKSSFFPVSGRGYHHFNIDDHRKWLNAGSSTNIPPELATKATSDYQSFVEKHLADKESFSIEVTLAKDITFDQAKRALGSGFRVQLTYVSAGLEECLRRVANRLTLGGHGVGPEVIRDTYAKSTSNLLIAMESFSHVEVYDNSRAAMEGDTDLQMIPEPVLEVHGGHVIFVSQHPPEWLVDALKGTSFDFSAGGGQ
jgi:predicted ABC-type ATPase